MLAIVLPAAGEDLSVAVLGSVAPACEGNRVGQMVNDTVEVVLSGQSGFRLVERDRLEATLSEQGINLAGVTELHEAGQVGRIVAAKLLVTGKVFELGESRVLTAKLIGTETTLVKAVMVQDTLDTPLDAMVLQLAERLAELLRTEADALVAQPPAPDPLPTLIAEMGEARLPVMAVVVPEQHIDRRRPLAVPDPAVETELKRILIAAGVEVRDLPDNELADWVGDYEQRGDEAWPRSLEGVDLVIVGEAFSEAAGQLGSLALASGRAEINVVQRQGGRVVLADRVTTRGVDLAGESAGKTALQKAGRALGLRLLEFLQGYTQDPPAPADEV